MSFKNLLIDALTKKFPSDSLSVEKTEKAKIEDTPEEKTEVVATEKSIIEIEGDSQLIDLLTNKKLKEKSTSLESLSTIE